MDSFMDATDVLESLQPSDHEDIKQEQNETISVQDAFTNDISHSYINSISRNSVYVNNDIIGTTKISSIADYSHTSNRPHEQNGANNCVDQQLNNANMKSMDKSQLVAIMHFLKKNNLLATEEVLRKETSNYINEDDIKSKIYHS